jgi:hypothetical protein
MMWRRGRPVPYEHRGAGIARLTMQTSEDVERGVGLFEAEADPWLRKMLAIRILDCPLCERVAPASIARLKDALRCRLL